MFSLALLTVTQPAFAQSAGSGIELLNSRHISVDQADRPHVESHIAVDPRDQQHLLATAMVVVNGETRSYPYASFDAGKTWARGRIIGDSSIIGAGAGDPVIYITNSGVSFFSTLAKVDGVNRSLVARSTDGGRTWRTTAVLPYADRQWLAFGLGGGPFGGRTYFTGTGVYQSREGTRAVAPFLARSDDFGLSFPLRTLVSYDRGGPDPTALLDAVPLEPLVTSRGLLVLPLQGSVDPGIAERAKRDSLNAWSVGLVASDDGGESFGPARYAPTPRLSVTGSPRRRLRGHSAVGYVRTAINASPGPYRDRLYFVAANYDPTVDRYIVQVWYTGDFGKTWGTAVASDAVRGDVANPAIAVNRDGIVVVTW
ncbi:MAG: exo-alpha-sialidase, partial [Gemmatimonadaceae bacterium]|nr:exo-alpha-sialidase [Gemmatimonadaceae bacterium]